MSKRTFFRIFILLVSLLSIALVVSPFQLSYVTSESMKPALSPGDAYIIEPASDLSKGDVITFYAPTEKRYITHRIVGYTQDGYITQGDNNPATDQSVGFKVVTKERVIGEVMTLKGELLTAPHVGFLADFINNHKFSTIAVLVLLMFLESLFAWTKKEESRDTSDKLTNKKLIYSILIASLVFLVGFNLISATTTSKVFIAKESGPTTNKIIHLNKKVEKQIVIPINNHPIYQYESVASSGEIHERKVTDNKIKLTVTLGPYFEEGPRVVNVKTFAYPRTLPKQFIHKLHSFNPLLASFFTNSIVLIPIILFSYVLVPDSYIRYRTRQNSREK